MKPYCLTIYETSYLSHDWHSQSLSASKICPASTVSDCLFLPGKRDSLLRWCIGEVSGYQVLSFSVLIQYRVWFFFLMWLITSDWQKIWDWQWIEYSLPSKTFCSCRCVSRDLQQCCWILKIGLSGCLWNGLQMLQQLYWIKNEPTCSIVASRSFPRWQNVWLSGFQQKSCVTRQLK